MKRSLLSLLLALGAVLAACNDKPPGQLEPIPRPPGYQDPPKAEAPQETAPAVDPNKVLLRWKLAVGAPIAFRLEGTPEASEGSGMRALYALQRPEAGDNVVRIARESPKASQEEGTFSERGFILDGLGEVDRNLATLLLELPKDPVGVGDTWTLGTDLVNPEVLGRDFFAKKSDRRNTVKLESLTAEGDEQVATLTYDLSETVSGNLPPGMRLPSGATEAAPARPAAKGKKGKGKQPEEEKPRGPLELTTQVTFKGSGQFLVKAGRWRSWQGTLSSSTQGFTPAPDKSPAQVPPGTLKLRLTALDAVPAQLQQPEAKK